MEDPQSEPRLRRRITRAAISQERVLGPVLMALLPPQTNLVESSYHPLYRWGLRPRG